MWSTQTVDDSDLSHMQRTVKGVHFPYPVTLAGGIVKTWEHVRDLADTDVIPEWGSIETKPSSGNGGRDYYAGYEGFDKYGNFQLLFALNSLGIPNPGMEYVERHARELLSMYKDRNKPLILNVSGKSAEDLLTLIKRALDCGFHVITANAACPNKSSQNILCFDTEAVDWLFDRVDTEIGETDAVILEKVSTGMPRPILAHNKNRVAESKAFTGIITGNTVPNCFAYRSDGTPAIKTANGITRGGMSGPAMHPIALDHTEFCASGMPEGKIVAGCGGAVDADTTMDFLRAGATFVQLNTAYREAGEDPRFMTDFLHDLDEPLRMFMKVD